MPIIIPANSAAGGGFEVDNSVRLDFASSTRFERTPSSASNRRTWTFSSWLKKAADENSNGDFQQVFSCPGSGGQERIMFEANKLTWDFDIPGVDYSVATVAVQRDHSAFYHIVVTKDTTQGTEANRVKMYINGVQQTLAEIQLGFPDQNAEGSINTTAEHQIWAQQDGAEMSGYACETCFVDGTALAADSFGEFDSDSGVWKPIDVSALTLGTNGYFLNYQDSSALGNSSNSNNYTTANLAAIDQTTDTCTNNFATINPLIVMNTDTVYSEGNLIMTPGGNTGNWQIGFSSIAVSVGKWYVETKMIGGNYVNGISETTSNQLSASGPEHFIGGFTKEIGYYSQSGNKFVENSQSSYGASYTNGDIIGMALDLDSGTRTITFFKNGASQGAITLPTSMETMTFGMSVNQGSSSAQFNFGNPPFSISSGNTDANDFGNFEYAPPSGHLALCTKNLSEANS